LEVPFGADDSAAAAKDGLAVVGEFDGGDTAELDGLLDLGVPGFGETKEGLGDAELLAGGDPLPVLFERFLEESEAGFIDGGIGDVALEGVGWRRRAGVDGAIAQEVGSEADAILAG
jgi:hypothetical protein